MAKNYLSPKELEILNRMITAYLELAELQALNRQPMTMKDWVERLDDFLKITGRDLLTHAGTISHKEALAKAHATYESYQRKQWEQPSPVETHFIEAINEVKKLEQDRSRGDEA